MSFHDFWTQILAPVRPTLTEKNVQSQKGRVFVVTGGNSGIGLALCRILYGTGATVYMASRSEERARTAISTILAAVPSPTTPGQIKFLPLDLNDLKSVRQAATIFAQQETKLDVLWNNAGMGAFRIKADARTAQELEPMMGMHCVATLLFTELLLPQLRAAAASSATVGSVRVVWVASIAVDDPVQSGVDMKLFKEGTPDPLKNYGISKVATWILGSEMARRYSKEGILSVTVNPGNVKAQSYDGAPWLFMLFMNRILHDVKFGAYTELFAGLSQDLSMEDSGAYIVPWGKVRPEAELTRQDVIKAKAPEEEGGLGYGTKLWEWCEEQWKLHL